MVDIKYVVAILYYKGLEQDIKHLDTIYSSEKTAKMALSDFLNAELRTIRENDYESNFDDFKVEGDNLYYKDCCLMKGKILEIKKEETLVDFLMAEYSAEHKCISKDFLQNAYEAFLFHYDIDINETSYIGGSLEKLTTVLGKDYRNSDLLFLIAEKFESLFDSDLDNEIDAWYFAIIDVVGEEKNYDAFAADDKATTDDVMDLIVSFQNELDFSNLDVECIKVNEKLINAIVNTINMYCEDAEISFSDIDTSHYSSDKDFKAILNIIKNVYNNY